MLKLNTFMSMITMAVCFSAGAVQAQERVTAAVNTALLGVQTQVQQRVSGTINTALLGNASQVTAKAAEWGSTVVNMTPVDKSMLQTIQGVGGSVSGAASTAGAVCLEKLGIPNLGISVGSDLENGLKDQINKGVGAALGKALDQSGIQKQAQKYLDAKKQYDDLITRKNNLVRGIKERVKALKAAWKTGTKLLKKAGIKIPGVG